MKTPVSIKIILLSAFVLTCFSFVKSNSVSVSDEEGFSLRGKDILLDGKPFYPKGYIFESVINKREDLIKYATDSQYEEYCVRSMAAQDFYFGEGDFAGRSGTDLARAWGANMLRFNLNQAALDPQNEFYSPSYVEMILRVVQEAKAKGFPVILTLFGSANKNIPEPMRNENPHIPMNTKVSLRAALKLTELFGDDPYVMLELVNEPYPVGQTALSWTIYMEGGIRDSGTYKGWEFVGVNTIIQYMRDRGAKNLIIVQGLGMSFKTYPGGIVDPLNKLVFSVHPFFGDGTDPDAIDWDGNFGFMADQYPFLITAWGAPLAQGWCPVFGLGKPQEFLDYINRKNIGMMAYAMDVPFTTIRDFRDDPVIATPLGNQCSTWAGRGTGEITKNYFQSHDDYTSVHPISERTSKSSLLTFPNPVTNCSFSIERNLSDPAEILLYNPQGTVVYACKTDSKTTLINGLQLSSGVYFLQVKGIDKLERTIKIIFK